MTYFWAHDSPQNHISHESEISPRSIVVWSGYLRRVCAADLQRHKRKLGGYRSTIVVDESHLAKRRPGTTGGRSARKAIWVVGGLDRTTGEMFAEITSDRTAPVMKRILVENIARGSTILTDCYPSYNGIEQWGQDYVHRSVDHSQMFRAEDGTHTNDQEAAWSSLKHHMRRSRGLARHLLQEYVDEWLYKRKHNRNTIFEALLRSIREDPRFEVRPTMNT